MRLGSPVLLAVSILCLPMMVDAQARDGLCTNGFGSFESSFSTGVRIVVGPVRREGFGTRACSAALDWGKNALQVVPQAASVDVDALGIDLGLGTPVLALQIKNTEADWSVTYNIYALGKPPHLLRTITGGSSFSAADTDLDGRIEIWTDDAKSVNGIDGLSVGEMEFLPGLVLRFEKHKLVDVSAEFPSHFDHQIAVVRAELDSKELSEFKASDGKLSPMPSLSAEQMHVLRLTKIRVLEIVWAFLYSGREREAWRELSAMWPPADLERIRSVIVNARNSGIDSQIDTVPFSGMRLHKKFAYIYETTSDDNGHTEDPMAQRSPDLRADSKPQAILLRRITVGDALLPKSEEMVDIVVDAAGKVRSAKIIGSKDIDLLSNCAGWKFIPAFKDGRPVASRMRLSLSYLR